MSESDSCAAVIGLPEPRDSYSRSPTRGYLIGTRMIEMIEEVIQGLVAEDREFIYQVLAQPMKPKQLLQLLNKVNDLLSKYSTFEKTASLGLYVSLPMAYTQSRVYSSGNLVGRNKGKSTTRSHNIQDTISRGKTIGETHTVSNTVGESDTIKSSTSRIVGENWSETVGKKL